MDEAQRIASPGAPAFTTAREPAPRLGRGIASLARRLADLIGRVTAAGSPNAPMIAFLEEYSAAEPSDGGGAPPADARIAPLDRLVDALSLSPVEVDLLLLAGMPDE